MEPVPAYQPLAGLMIRCQARWSIGMIGNWPDWYFMNWHTSVSTSQMTAPLMKLCQHSPKGGVAIWLDATQPVEKREAWRISRQRESALSSYFGDPRAPENTL